MFIASAHSTRGLDVSHRGGAPGFIEVLSARTLRIPDYSGNSMFQTLGNFALDARTGLAVPDFRGNRRCIFPGGPSCSGIRPTPATAPAKPGVS